MDDVNSAIVMINLFIVGFIRKTCITGNFCCIILVKPQMIISSAVRKEDKKRISFYDLPLSSHPEHISSFMLLL